MSIQRRTARVDMSSRWPRQLVTQVPLLIAATVATALLRPAPENEYAATEERVKPSQAAAQDRDARVALARLKCETAARSLLDALKRVEADIDRHAEEWHDIQANLHKWAVYAPGSGMSIPYPEDVNFPKHGKHIRAAAFHFELELMQAMLDVKDAWIRYDRDTQGLSVVKQADGAKSPNEQDTVAALRSENVMRAAHITMNLDDYLGKINEKYRASLRAR